MSKFKIIKFIANKAWLDKNSEHGPVTALSKNLPDWYREYDRYAKDRNGEYIEDPNLGGKIPTWKACPAIYDTFGAGYLYRVPCDIKIERLPNGNLKATVLDSRYQEFIQTRGMMEGFATPPGFEAFHFAWFPSWACQVPDGYSVLYAQPFNRYDLPFITTSGIIDNDKVHLPGSMPFFIKQGWEGIIEAGTPFTQLLPFKRDDWKSEIVEKSALEIFKDNRANSKKYRVPNGGFYQKSVWSRRKYE
jgi:hypothetical protein